jgi:glycosyltransferase involved in cell wall biosynthesis
MRIGVAEKIALVLAREFVGRGHQVDLVVSKAEGELLGLLPDTVTVEEMKTSRFRNMIGPLARYFRRRQPDATLVFMWPLNVIALAARWIARAKGRLIVSDHNTLSQEYSGRSWALWATLVNSIQRSYPYADARVIVSQEAADDLATISGLDRQSLTVITNPIDTVQRDVGSIDAARVWGNEGARILTVGRLKPQKNHRLLIEAFAILARQRPARLVILGDGELRDELAGWADALGIADRVRFEGSAINPWPYYRSADLFVLSSDYEGFGNVLVEAMIAGLPIVSTDCPSGPSEILDRGRFGRLVPAGDAQALADAMATTLDERRDPELMKQRAEQISGASVDRYLELMLGDPVTAAPR